MTYTYFILGAGRQGTAAAYDIARFGEAELITLTDLNLERASASAEQVNRLVGAERVEALALDVSDLDAVQKAWAGYTVALSAVPYYYNLDLTHAAIASGVSFCDLGGNTSIVRQQHALDPEARQAGVRIIPDCGMGPGMGNTLAVYAMELLDEAEHVYIFDGGLPKHPAPPWNYMLTFSIEGLTNEYYGGLTVLRDGELVHLPSFTELELIDFPPLGELEAFIVGGGVSTAAWTFKDRLKTYQLKILRYPGSFVQLKAFHDLGLYDPDPIDVGGVQVSPRQVFHALYGPQVQSDHIEDVCLIRVVAEGRKSGKSAQALVELVDNYDPHTGFTAMERTTGWHASIVAIMMARGQTPLGAVPLELAVPGGMFVNEAKKRGFEVRAEIL